MDSPETEMALAAFNAMDPRDQLGPAYRNFFDEHGIVPEKIKPEYSVCSIGFSEKEQKWYGWSHRAIYGFGVGSQVKKGDCGYVPKDPADFLTSYRDFWDDENHEKTWAIHTDHDGKLGVMVKWIYADTVPNRSLIGTEGRAFSPYPEFGRGEWTAQTLDDAKQMAIDFAEGVS